MFYKFTFENLMYNFKEVLRNGYKIITCEEYYKKKEKFRNQKILVNRVDIDESPKKAERITKIFNDLGIKATFFIRLHANEYNPFSFENYRIFKYIKECKHEIGYHSEIIDSANIWNENTAECLKKDIDVLNRMLDIKISGIASHGGRTIFNNLNFWDNKNTKEYGILYEAYDNQPEFNLFYESLYISDAQWRFWKCYNKGKLVENDHRSIGEHSKDNHKILYTLIHPETYYDNHIYE